MLGRSCEKADCACLKCICDVEQLYTDAALVLDTSTRVASAAEEWRDVDLWGRGGNSRCLCRRHVAVLSECIHFLSKGAEKGAEKR